MGIAQNIREASSEARPKKRATWRGRPVREGRAVRRTEDFRRIEALPRRDAYVDATDLMTEWLRTPTGEERLRREQAIALLEIMEVGGLVGSLACGTGKTLITLLAPVVLEAQRPLLLIPANLREKTFADIARLLKHWRLHPGLQIMSYEQLSQVKQADFLKTAVPDLIVADEAHHLAHMTAACTRRVRRHYEEFPATKFVGVTGSLTRRSLRDYAHLLIWAMGQSAPVPTRYTELEEWADALDENVPAEVRPAPGALWHLCARDEYGTYLEEPHDGFRRRLLETQGFVVTLEATVQRSDGAEVSLGISEYGRRPGHRALAVPQVVKDAFLKLRTRWETPDGGEFTGALDFAGHARELISGFFYRWIWPGGKVDHEWLDARRAWGAFVRHTIRHSRPTKERLAYDTEKQVADACAVQSLVPVPDEHGRWDADVYVRWMEIRDRCDPPTEAVWISDYLVDEAVHWAHKPGIIWTDQTAVLDRLRARGLAVFGGGDDGIIRERGDRAIVASLDAHREGKNLQMFNRMLYLNVPSSGEWWEQSLSRCHRAGQEADEVHADVMLNCIEQVAAFEQAREDARYANSRTGANKRLLYADITVTPESEINARMKKSDPLWNRDMIAPN